MASLYEHIGDYKMLQDLIEDESVTYEEVAEALGVIEGRIEDKVENISWFIRELESKIALFKSEEERLNKRRKTFNNKIEGLKKYLIESLDELNVKSINAGTFTVRKQKNPASLSIDKEVIPEKYLIPQPQESKVDSDAIKKDLKSGLAIEGVGYKPDSYHIRIQ